MTTPQRQRQHDPLKTVLPGYVPWTPAQEFPRQTAYAPTQALLFAGILLGSGALLLSYAVLKLVLPMK